MRCGRLGKHAAHVWTVIRVWEGYHEPHSYFCSGHVTIEGGHRGVR